MFVRISGARSLTTFGWGHGPAGTDIRRCGSPRFSANGALRDTNIVCAFVLDGDSERISFGDDTSRHNVERDEAFVDSIELLCVTRIVQRDGNNRRSQQNSRQRHDCHHPTQQPSPQTRTPLYISNCAPPTSRWLQSATTRSSGQCIAALIAEEADRPLNPCHPSLALNGQTSPSMRQYNAIIAASSAMMRVAQTMRLRPEGVL